MKQLKDRIRGKTRRTRGESLARIIADVNATLRGWFGYFKHAHRTTFAPLDKMIRRRLRALLSKQAKRPDFAAPRRSNEVAQHLLREGRVVRPGRRLEGCGDTPDEETTNWRAVCGKPARTVVCPAKAGVFSGRLGPPG